MSYKTQVMKVTYANHVLEVINEVLIFMGSSCLFLMDQDLIEVPKIGPRVVNLI